MLVFPVHAILASGACSCGRQCDSPGKHPMTPRGLKDASADPQQRAAWVRDAPNCNWAVPTGPENGFWVLDIDGPEGAASLAALEALHGPLPVTREVLTGGGGLHKYFLWPGDGGLVKNSASQLGPKLDVRGAGGYVLIPESNHVSGGMYLWLNRDQPIAPAPEWLLALVCKRPSPAPAPAATSERVEGNSAALAAFASCLHRLRTAAEGTRNATLNATAHTVAGLLSSGSLGVDENEARGRIWEAARECGLDDGEIEKSLGSGFSSGLGRPLSVGFQPNTAGFEQSKPATKYDPRFRFSADGRSVEHHESPSLTDEPSEADWRPVFTRLEVVADVRNFDGEDWASVVLVTDRSGNQHQWVMPNSVLSGDGSALRERLLGLGFRFLQGRSEKTARSALSSFLMSAVPTEKARVVDRLGWHGSAFILPDGSIGNAGDERVLIRDSVSNDHAFRVRGDLAGWQEHVARPCLGNSRFELALSAAFAAPLLAVAGLESGGVHLRGVSSSGKSTALRVAGSVWGGGPRKGYCRSWRSTDNGLESVAAMHNDALLCLDELSEADAKAAAAAAYMLSNGSGKTRAGRTGEGRTPATWRVLFLSTGEIGISDKISEDRGRQQITAGQAVRILDIAVDAGTGYGAFDVLNGHPSAESLAIALGHASDEFYGHPSRAYLSWLTTHRDRVSVRLRAYIPDFVSRYSPEGADAQVNRAAARFALIAIGGELAIEAGVLPWPPGSAERGISRCLADWIRGRGGITSHETAAAVAAVRGFIETHGASRFESPWESTGHAVVPNRAGFRKRESPDSPWQYFILPAAWKSEVCRGMDSVRAAHELVRLGVLKAASDGRTSRTINAGKQYGHVKVYCVEPEYDNG